MASVLIWIATGAVARNPLAPAVGRTNPLGAAARDDVAARVDNARFHAEETRRSEELFFSHAARGAGTPPARENARAAPHAWDVFSFSGRADDGLDGAPYAPFGTADLARASREPLFSAEECAAVIAEAEADPAWRGAQPLASYASNAPSFRPVRELPHAHRWFNDRLRDTIFPAVHAAFAADELSPELLRCSAASVLRYRATAGQTHLGVHRDGPGVAVTIALNAENEYDGGGTLIEALEPSAQPGHRHGVLRRPAGHVIMHPATVRHGGAPITRGRRYIFVAWLFSAPAVPHGHISTQRAARFLAAALRIAPASSSAHRQELLGAAADGYAEALRMGAAELSESAHVGLAHALLELGRPENVPRAEAALREALRLAPRSESASALLARARAAACSGVALDPV
ncbi:hypothetical protein KFE25_001088 [Diacronema lutheri]|uniref:Fe2OG dioxygenase domain-containing protein n=1 Tax=Diacronema lutheri TaxID=2081491 RepID=A0A8J6C5Y1_DIALT|nr:hypothetical protein KFE25_001088 [Diacronema lutheri]